MSTKWLALLALFAVPGAAFAQSSEAENTWQYTATAYGWFPGVSTTVETPVGDIEAEVDFDEILETLDIAFLGAFEARKGRVSLIGDLQFFDVSAEAGTPTGALFSEAEVDSQMLLFSTYALYALVDNEDTRFEIGGGLRYTDATVETLLRGQTVTPDVSFELDGGWADALIAARLNQRFNEKWYGVAYADVGGFGIGDSADLTWQASAGLGYRFNEKWSTVGGYRHLTIEREFDRADVEADISGPFLGVQVKF